MFGVGSTHVAQCRPALEQLPIHLSASPHTYAAGGLAVYLHIDYVREYLPPSIHLRGLSDAG